MLKRITHKRPSKYTALNGFLTRRGSCSLRPLCPRLCQLKRKSPGFQSGPGSLITTFKLKKRELVYLIEALKMFIPGANEKGALFC
jgi:hypothetical protein